MELTLVMALTTVLLVTLGFLSLHDEPDLAEAMERVPVRE